MPISFVENTVRFGDLVRECGRPQTVTFWADSRKDRSLRRAIRENRVLTVIQEPTSTRKGFWPRRLSPKPFRFISGFSPGVVRRQGCSCIGIHYALLDEPEAGDAISRRPVASRKASGRKARPMKTFKVSVRRIATVERQFNVRASDKSAAQQQAIEMIHHEPLEFESARVHDEVIKVE